MPEQAVQQELTYSQQRAFDDAYEEGRRKLWLAYLWAFLPVVVFTLGLLLRSFVLFFGLLGIHRFYLGRPLSAALMLCLWQGGFLGLTFAPIFFGAEFAGPNGDLVWAPFMCGALIWFLVDLALMPRMVRRYNEKLAADLRKDYTSPAGV
jgi:hypothetical protein